jgi:hypothetical protein
MHIRADGRGQLHIHAEITTEDGEAHVTGYAVWHLSAVE